MKKLLAAIVLVFVFTGCELPTIEGEDYCVSWGDGQCYAWNDIEKEYHDAVDGTDGFSAYELAVVGGFQGTEPEWHDSLIGEAGLNGYNGDKGDKGDKGESGDAGAVGVAGTDGDDGNDGDAGINGVNGDKGDKGDKGDDGTDGKDGVKGLSNYELAQIAGFEGSLEDWLISLVGASGADGVSVTPVNDKVVVAENTMIVTFHTRIVGLSGMEVGLVKDGTLFVSEPANVVRDEDGIFTVQYIVDINDPATYIMGMQFIK